MFVSLFLPIFVFVCLLQCRVQQGQFAAWCANIINIQGGRRVADITQITVWILAKYWYTIKHAQNTQSNMHRTYDFTMHMHRIHNHTNTENTENSLWCNEPQYHTQTHTHPRTSPISTWEINKRINMVAALYLGYFGNITCSVFYEVFFFNKISGVFSAVLTSAVRGSGCREHWIVCAALTAAENYTNAIKRREVIQLPLILPSHRYTLGVHPEEEARHIWM